jgi:hypothetical protein
MRKYIYITTLLLSFQSAVTAQNCIPDQSMKTNGFSPNKLDTAFVGIPYNMVLQVRALKDTTVILFGNPTKAYIDSIMVEKIIGLPASFGYSCNNDRCRFVPDTTGCAKLSGTALKGEAGNYPIYISILIYGKLEGGFRPPPQRDTVKTFSLVVRDLSSISDVLKPKASVYPNPVKDGKITIQTNGVDLPAKMELYSPMGQLLYEETMEFSTQGTDISRFNLPWIYGRLQSLDGRELWQGKLQISAE